MNDRRWKSRALFGPCIVAAGIGSTGAGGCVDVRQDTPSKGPDGPDWVDVVCEAEPLDLAALSSATCAAPEVVAVAGESARHVADDIPIPYEVQPPSSGDHRADWAKWGAYAYLPPQRWLHNLEHGGIAVVYDPCLATESVASLREYLQSQPTDETGKFRWILTPYPGLSTPVAIVAWERTLFLECWTDADVRAVEAFVDEAYRNAPEDVPFDGRYDRGWLGR